MLCLSGVCGRTRRQDTPASPFLSMKKITILLFVCLRACTPYFSVEAQTSTVLKQQADGQLQVVIPQGVPMETILALKDINKDMLNTAEKVMQTQAEVVKSQEWIDGLYWWGLFTTPLVLISLLLYLNQKERTNRIRAQIQYQIFTASQRSLPGYEPQVSGLPMAVDHHGEYITSHR